jgi:urease accessory protein
MVMDMDTDGALYRLLSWLSPAFPVGAYSYSHGIEYAVEAGLVDDAATLREWVAGIVENGAGGIDAVLFCAAWRAARESDDTMLDHVCELADAWRPTAEMALESSAQGVAFVKALQAAWPEERLDRWLERLAGMDRPPAYGVAVATATAFAGIALRPALTAYLHSMAANLVSAAVRLIPLGQSDGQRALAELEDAVHCGVGAAIERPLENIGGSAAIVDWTSMRHETQYTRLFRS